MAKWSTHTWSESGDEEWACTLCKDGLVFYTFWDKSRDVAEAEAKDFCKEFKALSDEVVEQEEAKLAAYDRIWKKARMRKRARKHVPISQHTWP